MVDIGRFKPIALLSSATLAIASGLASPVMAQSSGQPASGTTMDPRAQSVNEATSPDVESDTAEAQQRSPDAIQQIIVTARRTNEMLQSTPVAVTALDNKLLLQKQITNVTDLSRAAPALSIGTGSAGPATSVYLAIRGQAQNSPNSFADASVGIYVDGVYVARPLVGNLGFLDMASVEVLRGPQGTLFGRNTTGGALNLSTAAPVDEFTGYVKGGVGNYDQRVIEGVLNIPLDDTLAVRFAGRYDEHDGYYPNVFGPRQGGVEGSYNARATVKWTPDQLPITWTFSGDYLHFRDTGNPSAIAAINPAGPLASFYGISQGVQSGAIPGNTPIPLGPGFSVPASAFTDFVLAGSGPLSQYINPEFPGSTATGDWRTLYNLDRTGNPEIDDPFNLAEAYSFTSNLVIDLGDVEVKSITGYRNSDTSNNLSLTGTPTGAASFVSQYRQSQFSQELQISGSSGALDYIGGLYYFRETGDERSDSAIFYNTPIAAFRNGFAEYSARSVGVFGQVNYNITEDLRITGGLRYTWDKRFINRRGTNDFRLARENRVCTQGPNAGLTLGQAECFDRNTAKFDYPAWTAGIDYQVTPDVFVYAKTSGASMSGGFSPRPVPAPFSDSFGPEKVRDVEAGVKAEFLENRIRTNLAVFRSWQSDVQRIITAVFVDGNGTRQLTQFVTNSGKVNAYGGEFELTVLPWQGMTIDSSAAYLHAEYADGSRVETQLVGGNLVDVDRSGEPITQAPKWTASIGATQVLDLGAGELTLHGDYSYISGRYFDFFTAGDPDPAVQQQVAIGNQASFVKGYGLANAQVSFALYDPEIEITLWGRNLFDKAYFTNVFNSYYNGIGATIQNQGVPRTYGVTAAVRF